MIGSIDTNTIVGKLHDDNSLVGKISSILVRPKTQQKTVVPYTTSKTYEADEGYDYLESITVNSISYEETQNEYGTTITIGEIDPS